MGGSKLLDTASNIIVLCSTLNNLLETNADIAEQARVNGWKLRPGQNPKKVPVWLPRRLSWALLTNDYDVIITTGKLHADNTETTTF